MICIRAEANSKRIRRLRHFVEEIDCAGSGDLEFWLAH